MNIEQSLKAVEVVLKSGRVPMLWGPPGIGKTTAIRQLAEKYQVEFRFLTTNYLMLEHLTGIPTNNGAGAMVFSRPENIPLEGKGILLIDELSDGMLSIQKMLYSLILERSCNGHKLGNDWKLVTAGNRPSDGSGSSMLPSALITRMIHIPVCCVLPDFTKVLPKTAIMDGRQWINDFAIPNQLHHTIIAFIKTYSDKLYQSQAIPRTWEMLSNILSIYNNPDSILHNIIIGTIGPETGNDFFAFYRLAMVLPDIDQIILNPTKADIPGQAGIVYALSTALLYKADRTNFEAIIKYASRFAEKEIEIYLITSILNKDASLASLPGYINWHNKNTQYLN